MSDDLLRSIPRIKRARAWRLYTQDNRRLVDLWQCGGKALLGHKAPHVISELKNSAEKGLCAQFGSVYELRLIKVLLCLFPGKIFRMYQDRYSLNKTLCELSKTRGNEGLSLENCAFWRPFLDEKEPFSLKTAQFETEKAALDKNNPFIVLLPFPLVPEILVLDPSLAQVIGSSDIISPLILAGTLRAAHDLRANSERGICRFQKILRALGERGDKTSSAGPSSSLWQRQGIYLYRKSKTCDYPALFRQFLEAGFLLPPSADQALILPGELSAGEEAKLASLLSES
ncbi:MAG: hypothetical protein LBV68_07600 [Spirochaetaceae bacterium]|jgi:hypothetical protein|nr:hypothetical protein [Spirochaetaceae bacterium]